MNNKIQEQELCITCKNRKYKESLLCCSNVLGYVWNAMLKNLPFIGKYISNYKCKGYESMNASKEKPKFIRDWDDLVGLESENYRLEIDKNMGCGWIRPKIETEETKRDYGKHHMYLSTHTFYGSCYKGYTQVLQSFGFNVELNNWDKENW